MKYKVAKGIIINKLGDTFVAYDNESSTMHELNETAYVILEQIMKGKSETLLVKHLCKLFKIDEDSAKKDATEFIKILKMKNLVKEE
jgi:hypothetical protein